MLLAGLALLLTSAEASAAPPDDWPTELLPAVQLHEERAFDRAAMLSGEIARATRDPRVRAAAEALNCLGLMHSHMRNDRLDARGRLTALAQDWPGLHEIPDVQLALGIALAADHETTPALHSLIDAAAGFAARGRPDRRAEALVALAETWAVHGDWESIAIARMVEPPRSAEAAHRVRMEQIRQIREQLSGITGGAAAVRRVDLATAAYLAQRVDTRAQGLEMLAGLVQDRPGAADRLFDLQAGLTAAAAEACLLLADHYEAERRWEAALSLLDRVVAAGFDSASLATRRAEQIRAPAMELSAAPGPAGKKRLSLRVRNVERLQFELRRIDLERWLRSRRGEFLESALPTAGSLALAHEASRADPRPYEWWEVWPADAPFEASLPDGAYVAHIRADQRGGRETQFKQLLVTGPLRATMVVGRQRAVVWVGHRTETETPDAMTSGELRIANSEERISETHEAGSDSFFASRNPLFDSDVEALFWMHGSFEPRRIALDGGAAVFDLPPESRMLRDRRWVCLVKAGGAIALCRGELAAPAGARPTLAYAAVAGPRNPFPGETVQVSGCLLNHTEVDPRHFPTQVTIELTDAVGARVAAATAPILGGGFFNAPLTIGEDTAGASLNLLVRASGVVLAPLNAGPAVVVREPAGTPYLISSDLPQVLHAGSRAVSGRVSVSYPWGAPLAEARTKLRYRAVALPTNDPLTALTTALPVPDDRRLDAAGRIGFSHDLGWFQFPPGPIAVNVSTQVTGPDDRVVERSFAALHGASPAHVWMRWNPPAPSADDDLRFTVGWFDPVGLIGVDTPRLEIRREGEVVATPRLEWALMGMRSDPWRPPGPGTYEARVSLAPRHAPQVVARDTVIVGPAKPEVAAAKRVGARAELDSHGGERHVRLTVDGPRERPLLAVVAEADPLAALEAPAGESAARETVGATRALHNQLRTLLIGHDADSVRLLNESPLREAASAALSVDVRAVETTMAAGRDATFEIRCRGAQSPVDLLVRLATPGDAATFSWQPGELRGVSEELRTPLRVYDSAVGAPRGEAHGGASLVIPASPALPDAALRALFDGSTHWVSAVGGVMETARVRAPLPAEPGRYRFYVLARTRDGDWAIGEREIDLSTRPWALLSMPLSLVAGDRSIAAVRLVNPTDSPIRASVSLDGGGLLHAGPLRSWPAADAHVGSDDDGVEAPPRSEIVLRAVIEAVRPGEGVAVLRIGGEALEWERSHSYTVTPAADAAPDSAVFELRRSIYRVVRAEMPEIDSSTLLVPDATHWQREQVTADDRIRTGELLMLVEEFDLPKAMESVTWRQPMPANCVTYAGERVETRKFLATERRAPNNVQYDTFDLPAGRYQVETLLTATRPGVCSVPVPRVFLDGRPIRISVEMGDLRIHVVDAAGGSAQ